MKVRVIKKWEMHGITHKVGDIMTIPLHSPGGLPMISDRDAFLLDNGFIEEIKEPTRWKPEKGETYYRVGSDGRIYDDTWDDSLSITDSERFEIGDCFKTEEEAERVVEYLKALAVVRGDATSEFVKYNDNWFIGYDPEHKSIDAFCNAYTARNGIFGLPYFATREDAQRSIEQHKKEWLTIFGVKEEE